MLLEAARDSCPRLQRLAFFDGGALDAVLLPSVLCCLTELQELSVGDPGTHVLAQLRHIPSHCTTVSLLATRPSVVDVVLYSLCELSSSGRQGILLNISLIASGSLEVDNYATNSFVAQIRHFGKTDLSCLRHLSLCVSDYLYVEARHGFLLDLKNQFLNISLPLGISHSVEVRDHFKVEVPAAEERQYRFKEVSRTECLQGLIVEQRTGTIQKDRLSTLAEISIQRVSIRQNAQWSETEMSQLLIMLQEHARGAQAIVVSRLFPVPSPSSRRCPHERDLLKPLASDCIHVVVAIHRLLTLLPSVVKLSFPKRLIQWEHKSVFRDMIRACVNIHVIHLCNPLSTTTNTVLSKRSTRFDFMIDEQLDIMVRFLELVGESCKQLTCIYWEGYSQGGSCSNSMSTFSYGRALRAFDRIEQRIPGVHISTVRAQVEAWR